MKITRTSPLTGETATKEIDVTAAQIASWEGGELAQNAFPNADSDEREFIMTGYTEHDWNAIVNTAIDTFGENDDES